MNKELEKSIDNLIASEDFRLIGRIKCNHELNKEIHSRTNKFATQYECLILIPVVARDGYVYKGEMDLYGKLNSKDK